MELERSGSGLVSLENELLSEEIDGLSGHSSLEKGLSLIDKIIVERVLGVEHMRHVLVSNTVDTVLRFEHLADNHIIDLLDFVELIKSTVVVELSQLMTLSLLNDEINVRRVLGQVGNSFRILVLELLGESLDSLK